jgi:hypothetical protein
MCNLETEFTEVERRIVVTRVFMEMKRMENEESLFNWHKASVSFSDLVHSMVTIVKKILLCMK